MEEWKEYKLGDLYDVHNGLSKGGKFFGSGYPFLSFKTVFNNYFLPSVLPDLVQSDQKEQSGYDIKRGDVFVTRTSETPEELGMSSVALKDYPFATYNGFTKRLRPKDTSIIYPEFIGYYLRSTHFRAFFYGLASSMSTRASLANGDLLEMRVFLPTFARQKKIAKILKSLDDKIEVNRRINDNLEQQAQALFKSWFVDFEPFKDGEFVESELGMIPKGWRVESLSSIADYVNGLAMQRYRPKDGENGLPVLKIKELGQGNFDTNSEFCSPSLIGEKYIIDDGDIIFSWSGTLMVKIWCGGRCGLNQHLFNVVANNHPKWFVYQWTKHHLDNFIRIAKDKAVTMGHIKRGELDKAKVLVPDSPVMKKLSNLMKPIHHQWISNNQESRSLAELRDILLPKLMSGELRVPDTDLINEMLEKGIR